MIGRQVSRFRVLDRIGQGGMGEVYLARDISLDRQVALKFVTAGSDDPEAARRLLREAHAIAALDHPFICKVYEAGDSDGRPYLAMEYVDGETLKDRLAKGPLAAGQAVRIAIEIAEAMECAHAQGIIHRDLKPSNVMLGAGGHVKVMDFGIAKRLAAPGGVNETTSLMRDATATGVITGTLAYSSPEQLLAHPVDERSDVFAFGVLFYEMLAHAHPFERASLAATVEAILHEAPSPLPARAGATPLVEHVIARCLEKDRERRFPSFRDVRVELESGTAASAPPPPQRGRKSARIAAAVAAVVVAASATLLWTDPEWLHLSERALAFNARDWILIADCENLTGDPLFDRSLGVALDVGIAQSNYVNVYPRDRLRTTLQRMRRTPGPIDLPLASEIAQRDNVRAVLACSIAKVGDAYTIAGRVVDPQTQRIALTESVQAAGRTDVLKALDKLAARLRRSLGESVATLSAQNTPLPQATTSSLEALKMYAEAQRLDKDGEAAEQLLKQAIDLDPEFAMAHAALGRSYFLSAETERRQDGDRHLAKAISLGNRLTTRERLLIQASADDARGNREQAAIEYRSYLAQYPDDTRALFRLGWTYMAGLGQYENAVEAFSRIAAIDPKDTSALVNLATCYGGLRQYERAVETYDKAFAVNPDEILGIFVNGEYGAALVRVGRLADAETAFKKMVGSAYPIPKARGLRSLAFLDMFRGRYRAAIESLRQAIALNQGAGATVSVYRDRLIVANALIATGATDAARRELAIVDRMIASQSFGPEWLQPAVKIRARLGDVRDAERIAALIPSGMGNSVVASSSNRNLSKDQAQLDLARAEIEVAWKRAAQGAALAAGAAAQTDRGLALDTLAFAEAAAGRRDEAAARYAELIEVADWGRESQQEWFDAHLALGRLYEASARPEEARRLYERVAQLWKDGDANLVLLNAVRARLAVLAR